MTKLIYQLNLSLTFTKYIVYLEGGLGYHIVKHKILNALDAGNYQHVQRDSIDEKNLLAIGEITVGELKKVIISSNGTGYSSSPHHQDMSIEVHVIKKDPWYIKFYFIEPGAWFISVHK